MPKSWPKSIIQTTKCLPCSSYPREPAGHVFAGPFLYMRMSRRRRLLLFVDNLVPRAFPLAIWHGREKSRAKSPREKPWERGCFVERQKMTECSEGYATIEITVMVSYVWMIYSPSQPRARARVEITPRSHCARGNGERCVKNGSPFRSSPPQARKLLLMLPMTVGGWSKIRKKFLSEEIAVSQNFAKFSHWEISNWNGWNIKIAA